MAEKIRILLIKKGNISEAELARRINKTPQSFNGSMKRDNFTEADLKEIANAMDCEYKAGFIIKETGEEI
ncbi:MAG: XRE family transcriptional regulator [Oscillospiraceae bacterium]|nr:XRE family transcriptional regulator [Oscillospiraceae bacterium]